MTHEQWEFENMEPFNVLQKGFYEKVGYLGQCWCMNNVKNYIFENEKCFFGKARLNDAFLGYNRTWQYPVLVYKSRFDAKNLQKEHF